MKVPDLLEQRFKPLHLGVTRLDGPVERQEILPQKARGQNRPGGEVRFEVVSGAQVGAVAADVRLERPTPPQGQSAQVRRRLRGVVKGRRSARFA